MRFTTAPRLLAALILTIGVLFGCQSAQPRGLSDRELEDLLAGLRRTEAAAVTSTWQLLGNGRVLGTEGTASLALDDVGRYRLQFDATVRFSEMHDGSETWKLYPWGSVLEVEGREAEMSLIPMWVLSGFWISPDAPLIIGPGRESSEDGTVSLHLRQRDGRIPFEVLVDTARGVPIRVAPADGAPVLALEMGNHQSLGGKPIAHSVRWLSRGELLAEAHFDTPAKVAADPSFWSPPEPLSEARFNAVADPKLQVLDDGNGYLFVRPVINGQRVGWFLFDTGAPATILGLDAVRKLGLERLGEGRSTGVGGTVPIDLHAVDSVRLGPIEVGPIFAASRDVLRLGWRDIPIDGILGCDVIGRAVVEYDLRAGHIELREPATYELPHGARWQSIQLHEGKPVVRVPFEEYGGDFLLDTAAGGAFSIGKPLVDRLDLLSGRRTRDGTNRGVGGSIGVKRGNVRSLEFGGRKYVDVPTSFAVTDLGSYADPFPDGIIGIQLLHDHRIVLDLGSRRIAFFDGQNGIEE